MPTAGRDNAWRLVAAPNGADGALTIQTDARLYLANVNGGATDVHTFAAGRHGWLQVLRGEVTLGDQRLVAGDGAASAMSPP